jgi:hypothetical protein
MKSLNRKTTAHAIARLAYARSSVSWQTCIDAMPHVDRRHVTRTLQKMCEAGQLTFSSGMYSLTPDMREAIEADRSGNITPPPYQTEFKEWTGKFSIAVVPMREGVEPVRDISFHYVGTITEP